MLLIFKHIASPALHNLTIGQRLYFVLIVFDVHFNRNSERTVLLEVYRPGHQVMLTKVHDRKHSPDGESDDSCYGENTPSSLQPAYENISKVTEKRWRSESSYEKSWCVSSKKKRDASSCKVNRHESSCYHKLQETRSTTSTTSIVGNHLSRQQEVSHHGNHRQQNISYHGHHRQSYRSHHGNHRQPDTRRNDPRKSQTSEFYTSYQRSCLQHVSMTTTIKDDTTLAHDCSVVSEESTISRHCGAYSDHSDSDSLTSSPSGGATFPDLSLSREEHSSCSIQLAALQSLLECEQDFVDVMHRGIQMFSRPLRHHILTSQQHSNIFQNIEKVTINMSYKLLCLNHENIICMIVYATINWLGHQFSLDYRYGIVIILSFLSKNYNDYMIPKYHRIPITRTVMYYL